MDEMAHTFRHKNQKSFAICINMFFGKECWWTILKMKMFPLNIFHFIPCQSHHRSSPFSFSLAGARVTAAFVVFYIVACHEPIHASLPWLRVYVHCVYSVSCVHFRSFFPPVFFISKYQIYCNTFMTFFVIIIIVYHYDLLSHANAKWLRLCVGKDRMCCW